MWLGLRGCLDWFLLNHQFRQKILACSQFSIETTLNEAEFLVAKEAIRNGFAKMLGVSRMRCEVKYTLSSQRSQTQAQAINAPQRREDSDALSAFGSIYDGVLMVTILDKVAARHADESLLEAATRTMADTQPEMLKMVIGAPAMPAKLVTVEFGSKLMIPSLEPHRPFEQLGRVVSGRFPKVSSRANLQVSPMPETSKKKVPRKENERKKAITHMSMGACAGAVPRQHGRKAGESGQEWE